MTTLINGRSFYLPRTELFKLVKLHAEYFLPVRAHRSDGELYLKHVCFFDKDLNLVADLRQLSTQLRLLIHTPTALKSLLEKCPATKFNPTQYFNKGLEFYHYEK